MLGADFRNRSGLDFLDEIGFQAGAYLKNAPFPAHMTELDAALHYLAYGVAEEGRAVPFESSLPKALLELEKTSLSPKRKVEIAQSLTHSRLAETAVDIDNPGSFADYLLRTDSYKPLVVFGDSHSQIYRRGRPASYENSLIPLVAFCWAGSARGLRKAQSESNFGPKILRIIDHNRDAFKASQPAVVLHFGQVDIEFVFHFKRAVEGSTRFEKSEFESFAAESVGRYLEFVGQIVEILGNSAVVFVSGIFPPTWNDASVFNGGPIGAVIFNNGDQSWAARVPEYEAIAPILRELEIPSWAERTRLHRFFNDLLRHRSRQQGFNFVDIFEDLVGPDGVVAPEFISERAGTDLHLDSWTPAGRMAATILRQQITRILD